MPSLTIKFNGIRNQKTNIHQRFIGCSLRQTSSGRSSAELLKSSLWELSFGGCLPSCLQAKQNRHNRFGRHICTHIRLLLHCIRWQNKHLNCLMVKFNYSNFWMPGLQHSDVQITHMHKSVYILCTQMIFTATHYFRFDRKSVCVWELKYFPPGNQSIGQMMCAECGG